MSPRLPDALLLAVRGLRQGPWRWVIYEVEQLSLALELAGRGADYIETMAVRTMSNALRALSAAP